VQVPVSVLAVLLTSEAKFATTEPYPTGQISRDFTLPGIRVLHLLPPLVSEPRPSATIAAPSAPSTVTPTAEEELDNQASENVVSTSDLERQELNDSPIAAVEVTEEFAIPEDFEEDEDYVTEEVEVILDEESSAPEWNEPETETFQPSEQDFQQASIEEPVTETVTEPTAEVIAEIITEADSASSLESIVSEAPANTELIEAEITEEITVEGVGEADLLVEADGVGEIEVVIETDHDVEISIEADDLSSVEIQAREQFGESKPVQLDEESSMSETIEFEEELALENESENATQLISKGDIGDRFTPEKNDSDSNIAQSLLDEKSSDLNSAFNPDFALDQELDQETDSNKNSPQPDSFLDQSKLTADTIEIIEDESVTETYSSEEGNQVD
jgi:hypothetical protein